MSYDIDNSYLYEILDDYQCADEDSQIDIFTAFTDKIWSSSNKRRVETKYYTYSVSPTIKDPEIANIFNMYSRIPYTDYRTRCGSGSYIDMIRQKINNLYTIYCDERVCVKRDYHELLQRPKKMYYEFLSSGGSGCTATEIECAFEIFLARAAEIFTDSQKEKLHISWSEYKLLVNRWLWRIFNNYDANKANVYEYQMHDFVYGTEDSRIVPYITRSLSGYMKNYQKEYYGIARKGDNNYSRCECGNLFLQNKQNNRRLCDECRCKGVITKNTRYNRKRTRVSVLN